MRRTTVHPQGPAYDKIADIGFFLELPGEAFIPFIPCLSRPDISRGENPLPARTLQDEHCAAGVFYYDALADLKKLGGMPYEHNLRIG